jgi:phytoene dehydrogenase-like protein
MPSLGGAGGGLLLATEAHAGGWGYPVGGSQSIADELAADFVANGGTIVTGHEVRSSSDVEPSKVTVLDTSPEFLAHYADLPAGYRKALTRFRRGAAIAKVDFALSEAVPWTNVDMRAAPTVHLGGTRAEVAASENAVEDGRVSDNPYVLATQPTIFDPTRAPAGKHVLWAYIHVPPGSTLDPTELVTRQVERFAPGFRDTILASAARSAVQVAENNPNDIGGEMTGGAVTLWQLIKRPVVSPTPWRTPARGIYLASASTPPGPAVHGMNGWFAARTALRDHFGVTQTPLSVNRGRS